MRGIINRVEGFGEIILAIYFGVLCTAVICVPIVGWFVYREIKSLHKIEMRVFHGRQKRRSNR